jgi:hypothetical protein
MSVRTRGVRGGGKVVTMQVDQKILNRLDELIALGSRVGATANDSGANRGWVFTGSEVTSQWATSCLNVLSKLGEGNIYYQQFTSLMGTITALQSVQKGQGILRAAKEDCERGAIFDTRTLIEADLFGEFLEQAGHLLEAKYKGPAAVIAGAVVEDGLRKLCSRSNVQIAPDATLTPMNDALAKAGVYSKLAHDKLMPVIRLRNDAAHGKWDQFTPQDVRGMIDEVRSFMATHFS